MSQSLGSLVVSLEANMAQFNQNMNDAAQRTEESMRRMDVAAELAIGAIKALASAATAGMMAAIIKESIDAADNLRDMSQMTGVAVVELNGLGFAAGQAGGNLDSMVSAAGKLNRAVTDAAKGGKESGAAFQALGIDITDAAGNLKKADVVMAEVADQFAKYDDGPEKAAIALTLFGKAGADMIPLLNDGGEALRSNTEYAKQYSGMSKDLADMSDEFNDKMGKLTVQQQSFGNAMATAVLPVLNQVGDRILGATENTNKWSGASAIIKTVFETFVILGSEVAHTFHMIGDEIGGRLAQLTALAQFDWQGAKSIGAAMAEDQARALASLQEFQKKILNSGPVKVGIEVAGTDKPAAPRLGGGGGGGGGGNGRRGMSEADRLEEEGKRLVARLREQDEAFGLSGAELLEYQLSLSKIPDKYKDLAMAAQIGIDAQKKATDEQAKIDAARIAREQEAARATLQNESNVEQIRASMLSEVEVEAEMHRMRLAELQKFHDAKLDNTVLANQLIAQENERHLQVQRDIKMANDMQMLAAYGNTADQLYALLKQSGAEQSSLAKAAFLASKAIAVAEIIMQTNVAAAKAKGQLGIFGLPMSAVILATGYAQAGMVAGLAIASAEGGYDIPAGKNPITQLHEKEMVLPKAQAEVIRGLANGGGSGGSMPAINYSPTINIDSRSDQAQVQRLVQRAVQDGNADLVERMNRQRGL